MPTTRDGRVIIQSNSILGMDDFARLYSGNERSPQENASFIHTNFPMQAKSAMDRSWRRLGIKEAPEQFFTNPANLQRLQNGGGLPPPAPSSPSEGQWMNPNLPTAQRVAALQAEQQEAQAQDALSKMEQLSLIDKANKSVPIPSYATPDLLAAQLAGDPTGLARKIMIRNQTGISPDEFYARGGNSQSLKAYIPNHGYGTLSATSTPVRLDEKIINDPDFQKALATNPEIASQVYLRLTGRPLQGDMKGLQDTREAQIKIGRDYTQDQLKNGAKFDPVTGKWKVWRVEDAPESAMTMLGGVAKPFRQLVDASDEQNAWMNQNYEFFTGKPLVNQQDTPDQARSRAHIEQKGKDSPEFQAYKVAMEKKLGRTLNAHEIVDAWNESYITKGRTESEVPWWAKPGIAGRNVIENILESPFRYMHWMDTKAADAEVAAQAKAATAADPYDRLNSIRHAQPSIVGQY